MKKNFLITLFQFADLIQQKVDDAYAGMFTGNSCSV